MTESNNRLFIHAFLYLLWIGFAFMHKESLTFSFILLFLWVKVTFSIAFQLVVKDTYWNVNIWREKIWLDCLSTDKSWLSWQQSCKHDSTIGIISILSNSFLDWSVNHLFRESLKN